MITINDAELIIKDKLKELGQKAGIEISLMTELTMEFQYGWMFFYQSSEYVKTKNSAFLLGGNAPLIVDKLNSSVHTTGTRRGANFYIELYCKFRELPNLFHEKKNE